MDVVFADDDFVVVVSADGLAVFEEDYLGEGEAGYLEKKGRKYVYLCALCVQITCPKNT